MGQVAARTERRQRIRELLETGGFEAVAETAAAVLSDPAADPVDLHHLALACYKLGQWDRAREYLELTLRRAPDSAASQLLMGLLILESGDPVAALPHLGRAVESGARSATALSHRAGAMFATGDMDRAKADLLRAIELDPDMAIAHYNLGVVAVRQRRWEEARAAFERYAALDRFDVAATHPLFTAIGRAQVHDQLAVYGERLKTRMGGLGDHIRSLMAQLGSTKDRGLLQRLDGLYREHHRCYTDLSAFLDAMSREPVQLDLVDLHQAIETCLFVTAGSIDHLDIVRETDPRLPAIVCDGRAIRQALINVILNAADAVPPDHGKLVITTTYPGGDELYIGFEDNGPGIEPDALPRIFDFGFTTKEDGSGIGLTQAQRQIRMHGGEVKAQSAPTGGARFTITLPVNLELRGGLRQVAWRAPFDEPVETLL